MTAGTERLPWLVEPLPEPRARRGGGRLALIAIVSLVAVAATFFLMRLLPIREAGPAEPSLTSPLAVPVPQVQALPTGPAQLELESKLTPEEAMPVATPPRIEPVRPAPRTSISPIGRSANDVAVDVGASDEAQAEPTGGRAVFPADEAPSEAPPVAGPRPIVVYHPQPMRGRVVQLGAFASASAADRVWRGIVWSYPYLAAKPKVLSPVEVRDPRTGRNTRMYRLQLATSSQAQSAVICQQLAKAWRNCTVVY